MSKFGLLGQITIFQSAVSYFLAKMNPAVIHNIGKYMAIKKAFYLSAIEQTEGDYYEFGVYTGSSFTHAIRCAKFNEKFDPGLSNIKFYGFDSFEGFGDLDDSEKHSFYTDINFETDYNKVFKRVNKILPSDRFDLVDGFFENTLISKPKSDLARIIFIDSDTYSSAELALNYLCSTIQKGTIIILDDYFSYKGSKTKGVYGAFQNFIEENNIVNRTIFSYGMGGIVKIVVKR
jgi:hypothetical protein